MQAIIDYCYEGNVEVEFRGQENATRKWFHAPWLHPSREFTHGLTGERLSRTHELAATQSRTFRNFAVGRSSRVSCFTGDSCSAFFRCCPIFHMRLYSIRLQRLS